jgi:hypothetical protein
MGGAGISSGGDIHCIDAGWKKRGIRLATLSLNTSITSSQRDDFYTGVFTDGNNIPWVAILNLYGSYFTDSGTSVPCEDMIMYGRTQISQSWKEMGRYNMCGYYSYCYIYFTWAYGFWYNFNNSGDPDNYQFFDKVRVNYGGMSAESFVNRTNLNIHTVDTNNNTIPSASISVSCYSLCGNLQWIDKTAVSDSGGNAAITFFNPPGATYNPSTYRVYRISATKNTLSGIKDETIPNQQDYSSTVQLACPTNINSNLVVA